MTSNPTLPANDRDRAAKRRAGDDTGQTHSFVVETARLLQDRHFEDVLVFDVRDLSDVTDYIVIASGTSDRQIKAVGDELEDTAKSFDLERFGRDIDEPSNWLVLDFVDAVVHLFEPMTRAHYDLEMMWDDAPTIAWHRDS